MVKRYKRKARAPAAAELADLSRWVDTDENLKHGAYCIVCITDSHPACYSSVVTMTCVCVQTALPALSLSLSLSLCLSLSLSLSLSACLSLTDSLTFNH